MINGRLDRDGYDIVWTCTCIRVSCYVWHLARPQGCASVASQPHQTQGRTHARTESAAYACALHGHYLPLGTSRHRQQLNKRKGGRRGGRKDNVSSQWGRVFLHTVAVHCPAPSRMEHNLNTLPFRAFGPDARRFLQAGEGGCGVVGAFNFLGARDIHRAACRSGTPSRICRCEH